MYKIKISENSHYSKVQQIVNAISTDINNKNLPDGYKMPSINVFSKTNSVARDTIEKAYGHLRKKGLIASMPGNGYFVSVSSQKHLHVLLIFNRLSSFKKKIYEAFLKEMGKKAKVHLQIHHYDPHILSEILDLNRGKYDMYVIMPHFFTHTKLPEILSVLRTVPSHQLLLLDKNIAELKGNISCVYQDFSSDIYQAMLSAEAEIQKYKSITLLLQGDTHHPIEIISGIKKFCKKINLPFNLSDKIDETLLSKKPLFIVIEEEDLALLIKKLRLRQLLQGRDVGIISFNETVLKEVLDITVVTTDFSQMGKTAAKLILEKTQLQVKNPIQIIQRGSL